MGRTTFSLARAAGTRFPTCVRLSWTAPQRPSKAQPRSSETYWRPDRIRNENGFAVALLVVSRPYAGAARWAQPAIRLRKQWVPIAFLTPAAAILIVFLAYPLIDAILLSFKSWDGIRPAAWVGFGNYASLLQDRIFWSALGNTAYFTIVAVV